MSKKSYHKFECPHCGESIYDDECRDLSHLIDECYDDGWEDGRRALVNTMKYEGDGAILTDIAKVIELQQYGFGMTKENALDEIMEIMKRRPIL